MKKKTLTGILDFPPWKPKIGLVPHLTIETNMTCNFICKSCYNLNHSTVKTPDQIISEIDAGLSRRKADTITLMGGEPTLHPEIETIIQYVKSKGVFCQLLTNGYVFYTDENDTFLQKLVHAGLDRILLHVDTGQEKYSDPIQALHTLFRKTEKYNLLTSISWTIYENEQGKLPSLVKEFMHYPHFDGMLTLLEKSVDLAIQKDYRSNAAHRMFEEYYRLKDELQLVPSIYLPSSLADDKIKWLVYLYYINSTTGKTFYVSPLFTRLYQKLYLRVYKREIFGNPPTRWALKWSLLFSGIIESVLKLKRMGDFLRLIQKSKRTEQIRVHYLAIQDGPEFEPDKDEVSICYHCPDATVRNGKITPVCLADRINPLPGVTNIAETNPALAETVYRHLNEI